MVPGHVHAHPHDPALSYVTLHTSSTHYLPGHLLTVTVRSSRDFMGFLLQARSVERSGLSSQSQIRGQVQAEQSSVGPGGMGSMLLGGAWTLTPPGTHTIRCVSDDDTVTHSDKQLKRNLSFVWRAPDRPMGDVRFFITVVQSYFVYWTGIPSPVLHDGTRSRWRGNSMMQDHITTSAPTFAEKLLIDEALPNPSAKPNSAISRIFQNTDQKPKVEVKAKLPPNIHPDRGGKYPDIIPRHSAWELGMLLGCSAGLGMVLVVGIRYVHRKACGKRTQVTLHDREREYSRGERGLIHVQECGDLVRVRRIRENSFVLLAEYDILATPGD
ncbi:hypothetical protein WMY93_014665 [Mugilogobius chulae]|uniref:Reelin domain-containing protein n=1 Tax=Mugilogobius chulae TaxID=88201 RepID=A0AAW0NZM8_9GOBI